ncbi:hypothetical protein [Hymenobacter negativus]|uniref:DUF3379 family protein n=1 Tax=Hymenobacter negativus TaxID=2795026 RepID=A0ABS3QMW4_9BACT|nr:hypothetical protein [Hymenobacter negativus]MBO2012614.1 hypothetical protein [Hymenobacter negativus]
MSNPSEDNLLDQSLRDVFRDYDLPPDAHPRVWEGVAERIATLPAPSAGFPYRLLLPFTAAVGIGLGWLLPHPEAQPASQAAAPVVQVAPYAPAAVPAPAAQLPAMDVSAVEAQPTAEPVAQPQQAPRKRRADVRPISAAQSAAPVGLDSAGLAAVQTALTPEVVVPTETASATTSLPVHIAAAPQVSAPAQQLAPSASAKTQKPAGNNEKIGYRKLTQRQPENRRGIGRWFTRFFQGVRHLLS